jgi:hypothetical protein
VTIFDYIKFITTTKQKDVVLEQYVPFLTTRWLSFINPQIAEALNIINKQILIENKDMHYKMLLTCFPKTKYTPRISYIKKVKQEEQEEDKKIKYIAEQRELGQREIKALMELIS